ncbi:mitochondrial chaperone [Leishmania donovani]|uniref:Mitochondrial_chaperone_putative/GeneDB:LmjF.22.0 930/GeneDB:LmjF.22.0940 n=1 Tax=Leishmania donovani TaxID=5661 RepID=A0A6J8FDY4_LEIDO|nr:mitochondrial chaperone [Leishmania donovani]VDZ44673.1 mitochondrial_chaperone_putative/GeneDB:LmjF.22.0930/GeneDB:LmjF.22.0940 [Leishmania donovani]
MTSPGTVGDVVDAFSSVPPAHMPGRLGNYAVQYLSNHIGSLVQSVPVMFVYVLFIGYPLFVGLLRVVRPLLESWIMGSSVTLGTVVGLPYIKRNIIVQLPPFFFVEVPNHNILLQNAVLMYVCHHLWRQKPLPSRFFFQSAHLVALLDPYRPWHAYVNARSPFYVGPSKTNRSNPADVLTETQLERLRLIKIPHKSWTPVMSDDIELYFKEEPLAVAHYSIPWTRRTLSLRCRATPGSAAKLDEFVQRALEVFAEGAPGKEDDALRWFFAYGGESDDKVFFNQYVLRSNKGFDTLFFPQRDATLTLINQFMQRRGRFAVEGFPQRLGFLVYGPPGTGRHAFVKALAAHTGRHIVSVPLSKLRTNQQLYEIFFAREYQSEEGDSVQKLRMEDVIFLFDDVDAADSVVCARAARRVVQRRAAARLTARAGWREAPLTNCVIEMDTSSSRPVMRVEDNTLPLALLLKIMGSDASKNDGASAVDRGGGRSTGGRRQKMEETAAAACEAGAKVAGGHLLGMNDVLLGDSKDKLDLSGLLNVLDGVVDMPGRMVVMITEHPEWLDPALIRPGRFSVRLRLDYMEMETLVQMLGLYYGDVAHSRRGSGAGADGCAAGAGVGGRVEAACAAQYSAAGSAAGCVVHRELSEAQVARVRGVVAALEAEADAAGAREVSADGSSGSGSGESKYRFQVTPCEVEMLCMEQDDLEGFLSQLAGLVRGTVQL